MQQTVDFSHLRQSSSPQQLTARLPLLDVSGRIGRLEYFFYSLVIPFLVFWIVAALAGIITHLGELGIAIAYVLLASGVCAAIIIHVQLTIKRCHDFNASGWLALLLLLPLAIILFWMVPGNKSDNRFGLPPAPSTTLLRAGAGLLLLTLVAGITFLVLQMQ